ncbi:natterin-3-like [Trematomus bernacchii]|uniref:natterin-3-like n=1 Tax=Trematomus bernacchii TaxID=40690 RepID=UPI00146A6EF9|nr:natterin-3-like [Trematomus bernacchii]
MTTPKTLPTQDAANGDCMKLSVLLLLALPALSSAFSPLDTRNNTEQRNVSFMNSDQPHLTGTKLRQKRQIQSSVFANGSNLKWVTWNNSVPNNSVSIYNSNFQRTDYICKHKCGAGFYTPGEGPHCYYASAEKASYGSPFALLVNQNNFEILEWKKDSGGSVPKSSVKTCPGGDIYVGKSKYGLGNVATKAKSFYLPWEGQVYTYEKYEVLTITEDINSQEIYDVKYHKDKSKMVNYPPEIIGKTSITNKESRSVVKKDTFSKTYQTQRRWDHEISVKLGTKTTVKAGIPFFVDGQIEISIEVAYRHNWGTTETETVTNTINLEITAPPNHSCIVNIVRYKNKVDIPFTALIRRTYANGEIHITSITGTYNSVDVAEVRAVVERCEPLDNSKSSAHTISAGLMHFVLLLIISSLFSG